MGTTDPVALTVSVALCTWNGRRWLEEQLRSILDQTRLVDEIVVVDDASSDGSASLAAQILSKSGILHRIEVNVENIGSTRSFERAASLCSGDLIVFSDQDDFWFPEKLSRICQTFADHPGIEWVFSDLELADENMVSLGSTMWRRIGFGTARRREFGSGRQLATILKRPIATGAAMAVRRDALRSAMPFPPEWIHDQWMSMVLAASGRRGFAMDERLVRYRIHSSQQVGERQTRLDAQVKRSIATGEDQYLQAAARLDALASFLRDHSSSAEDGIRTIRRQASHFRIRAAMRRGSRLARIPMIVSEFLAGNYSLSWSPLAPAKDLLL